MREQYLPSVCQLHAAIYNNEISVPKSDILLKQNEVTTLQYLIAQLLFFSKGNQEILDGYFVGYSIPQLGNEFDLLRFGENVVVNIELKNELPEEIKEEKISAQLKKHSYYLKFLGKPIELFTFVESDGLYRYNTDTNTIEKVNPTILVDILSTQILTKNFNIEYAFNPANYLISPFNKVNEFLNGEYFLTPDQSNKKIDILNSLKHNEFLFYCIQADAGTGKTLLAYDIAKDLMLQEKHIIILHCATLNEGQELLNKAPNWDIRPVRVLKSRLDDFGLGKPDLLIVDESQRIQRDQLDKLVCYASKAKIPLLFLYDPKQFLRSGETCNIFDYLSANYPAITAPIHKLTTRIRTNKKLASFIYNLFNIGHSRDNLDYEDISIEYFKDYDSADRYIKHLESTQNWKFITFTASQYRDETVDALSSLSEVKAHNVIGQDFPNVVFAMDANFWYNENKLMTNYAYYSIRGMLYQIVTRAVSKLKIVVVGNQSLYEKLIAIKHMGSQK